MDPFVVLVPGVLDGRGAGDVVPLPPATSKHLRTVLRRPVGSGLVLADGAGVTVAAELADEGARCLDVPVLTPAPRPAIHVLQGLAKGRKLDEVVRVLTELGVDAVTPVAADRSVKELDGAKRDRTLARWRAVATAASEQARRPYVPVVGEPATVDELLRQDAAVAGHRRVIAAHVGAAVPLSSAVTGGLREVDRVVLAVGPEGGWTSAEVARFEQHGAAVVSMGDPVLRTEHAAAALVAVVMFTVGRMD